MAQIRQDPRLIDSRAIQGMVPTTLLPPPSAQPPHFPDIISKVAPSEKKYQPSTPSLPEYRVLRSLDRLHGAGEKYLHIQGDAMEIEAKEFDKLAAENIQKIREAAEKGQSLDSWYLLRKVSGAVVASLSIGGWFIQAQASPVAAAAMLGSGVITLSNMAFSEAGVWDWAIDQMTEDEEQRKHYKTLVPTCVGLIGAGLGLAAFGASYSTINQVPQPFLLLQGVGNASNIVATVGSEVTQARVNLSQADLTKINGKIAMNRHKWEEMTQNVEEILRWREQRINLARAVLKTVTNRSYSILA